MKYCLDSTYKQRFERGIQGIQIESDNSENKLPTINCNKFLMRFHILQHAPTILYHNKYFNDGS